MAENENEPKTARFERWAVEEIRACQKRNRELLALIVDLMIENERMRRQLELFASLGIRIERETMHDED